MTYDSIYEAVYDNYSRDGMWDRMLHAGEPDSFNLAEEALGRHADSDRIALRIRDFETGATERYSFRKLDAAANRAANYLEAELARGERFGVMLPPRLELYAAIFGGIKSHRVFVPLDTKFGPEAVGYRLDEADATTIVTVPEKLDAVDPDAVPSLERVVLVGGGGGDAGDARDDGPPADALPDDVEVVPYASIREHADAYDAMRMHPSQVYALGYSSGTTGQPSQQPSPHATCVAIEPYLRFVVDLQPDDVYFAAASPAWSYGLTVGTLTPGMKGAPIGAYRGRFDAERWVETLDEWGVTNAMIAPTALRQLRSSDVPIEDYDVDLRVFVTAGETMGEETSEWCREHLGAPPLDAYGLSEGGMTICNYAFPDWELKPGSMGKPLPGYEVALADPDGTTEPDGEDGTVDEIAAIAEPDTVGEIAIKQTGYGGPLEGLVGGGEWLLTGDLAEWDTEGYWWYRGRADEVIISAGYRIGPEEVEQTLVDHGAVAEAAVIGSDDDTRGQIVKAYVTTADGHEGSEALRKEIVRHAKDELSKHEYPRELEFLEALPKTASDKIHRRKLKARDDGDEAVERA